MEEEFVDWLKSRLPHYQHVELGIGDDAAVLADSCGGGVVTTDLLCDQIHFQFGSAPPIRVGQKAMAVNLSDMAAMAAIPRAAFISLLWPEDHDVELAKQLYEGMIATADRFDVAIAGGDTNRGPGRLVISVTLIGQALPNGPLLRSTAQVGDAILVTGELGGSILGRHFDFKPRVHEAIYLHEHYGLGAGIDISDGLSLDLQRLCVASRVGAILDLEVLPISQDAIKHSTSTGRDALEHALTDGEDFELLVTVPSEKAELMLLDQPLDVPLTRIGTIVDEPGLWGRHGRDRPFPLQAKGYLH